jgi:aminopeptidase N
MSTYLVAFVLSYYKSVQNANGHHRLFAPAHAQDQVDYSLKFGEAAVEAFDEFTAFPYFSVPGIEKFDQISIPDFSFGAMENWGLMTYK